MDELLDPALIERSAEIVTCTETARGARTSCRCRGCARTARVGRRQEQLSRTRTSCSRSRRAAGENRHADWIAADTGDASERAPEPFN